MDMRPSNKSIRRMVEKIHAMTALKTVWQETRELMQEICMSGSMSGIWISALPAREVGVGPGPHYPPPGRIRLRECWRADYVATVDMRAYRLSEYLTRDIGGVCSLHSEAER
jgi:hypothetical protein